MLHHVLRKKAISDNDDEIFVKQIASYFSITTDGLMIFLVHKN